MTVWKYDRSGVATEVADDLIGLVPPRPDGDEGARLHDSGWYKGASIGTDTEDYSCGIALEVYSKTSDQFLGYLVEVSIADRVELVYCEDLFAYMEFLRRAAPALQVSREERERQIASDPGLDKWRNK